MTSDLDVTRRELRKVYAGNLCVTKAEHAQAQLTDAQNEISGRMVARPVFDARGGGFMVRA